MTTQETIQLINAVCKLQLQLEKILDALNKPQLGFHSNAGTCYVYCNRQHGCNWYSLDLEHKPLPIHHAALTGYLKELRFEKVERRGKEVHKLLTTICADRLYILESGHDSHFSKGLLSAIASLAPYRHKLLQPITIVPTPGDDESVLFCRVWLGGEQLLAKYSEQTDWREVAKKATSLVKAVADEPTNF